MDGVELDIQKRIATDPEIAEDFGQGYIDFKNGEIAHNSKKFTNLEQDENEGKVNTKNVHG